MQLQYALKLSKSENSLCYEGKSRNIETSCNPHLVNAQGTKVADSLMSA